MMTPVSENLKTLRKYLKLKQPEMAEKLNIQVHTVKNIESSKANPSREVYEAIEQIYGIKRVELDTIKLTPAEIQERIEIKNMSVNEPSLEYKIDRSEKDLLKDILQLRALAKTLFHEVAATKAERENLSLPEAIYQLNQITNQNLLALVG